MSSALSITRKVPALFRLVRVVNLWIIVVSQYLIRWFIIGPEDSWKEVLLDLDIFLIALSTALIAAAGYVINDYYDVKIDVINKPKRVVIDRDVTRRQALLMNGLFNGAALVMGYLLSWKMAAVFFVSIFLLWWYSNSLKRQPLVGNITIAFLSALSIFQLSLYYHDGSEKIITMTVFAFFISLMREIIKDVEDMQGDVAHGCKTLPIAIGLTKTKWILILVDIAFMGVMVWLSYVYLPEIFWLLTYTIGPLLGFLGFWVYRSDQKRDFKILSTFCKIIMIVGSSSLIFT